ncbi:MAG: hypothetical protein ACYDH3_00110 [Candidatus Aminicenantales bacterium]
MSDKSELNRRIELEVLITEREGMLALNTARLHRGEALAYCYEAFAEIAEKMRALKEPERTLCPGEDLRDCGRPEATGSDAVFIRHIQAHLHPGQDVICKICGKSAHEIIGSAIAPPYTPDDVERLVEAAEYARDNIHCRQKTEDGKECEHENQCVHCKAWDKLVAALAPWRKK